MAPPISANVQRRPRFEESTSLARSTSFCRPVLPDAAYDARFPKARLISERIKSSASSGLGHPTDQTMTHKCREQLCACINAHARSVEKGSIFCVEEVGRC